MTMLRFIFRSLGRLVLELFNREESGNESV